MPATMLGGTEIVLPFTSVCIPCNASTTTVGELVGEPVGVLVDVLVEELVGVLVNVLVGDGDCVPVIVGVGVSVRVDVGVSDNADIVLEFTDCFGGTSAMSVMHSNPKTM